MSDETQHNPVTVETDSKPGAESAKATRPKGPAPGPTTVRRLKAIKPKQRIVYYVGLNLSSEISASRNCAGYAGVLAQVSGVASRLAREGRARLTETSIEREYKDKVVHLIEYAAISLDRKE